MTLLPKYNMLARTEPRAHIQLRGTGPALIGPIFIVFPLSLAINLFTTRILKIFLTKV